VDRGYSGTPLERKLGIKPDQRVLVDGAPAGFTLSAEGSTIQTRLGHGPYAVALVFCPDRARLEARWPLVLRRMTVGGALWVAWPKRASGVPTDLTEDVVREVALARGLVDVKVCAVDETWSALKLVTRLADR
jgi:hypothetical protein